jgi:IS605 OrfB family transposase
MKQQLTIKLRLRDKHTAELNRQAGAVNVVWNYCGEIHREVSRRWRGGANVRFPSAFELMRLTAGAGKDLNIHGHTIQRVCDQYVISRKTHRKSWVRFRGRKSLGWVPFNTGTVSFDGEAFTFRGARYETMHLRDILTPDIKIGAGSFNQDARGRWYINCPIEVDCAKCPDRPVAIGIDLGLKSLATLSNGREIKAPQFYRASEARLAATAQRAKKTKRARAIHRKIANRRKDFLHKESKKLADKYWLIVVGDVSPSKLAQTKMAKSIHDAGWSDLKRCLRYKALMHGGGMLEVCERYTTQICSECGTLGGPKGTKDLRIREWQCRVCGEVHHRDRNSARNILATGLGSLGEGTPT